MEISVFILLNKILLTTLKHFLKILFQLKTSILRNEILKKKQLWHVSNFYDSYFIQNITRPDGHFLKIIYWEMIKLNNQYIEIEKFFQSSARLDFDIIIF